MNSTAGFLISPFRQNFVQKIFTLTIWLFIHLALFIWTFIQLDIYPFEYRPFSNSYLEFKYLHIEFWYFLHFDLWFEFSSLLKSLLILNQIGGEPYFLKMALEVLAFRLTDSGSARPLPSIYQFWNESVLKAKFLRWPSKSGMFTLCLSSSTP